MDKNTDKNKIIVIVIYLIGSIKRVPTLTLEKNIFLRNSKSMYMYVKDDNAVPSMISTWKLNTLKTFVLYM